MKKIISVLIAGALAASMCAAMAGCGSSSKESKSSSSQASSKASSSSSAKDANSSNGSDDKGSSSANSAEQSENSDSASNSGDNQSDDPIASQAEKLAINYLGLSDDPNIKTIVGETVQVGNNKFTCVTVVDGSGGSHQVFVNVVSGECVSRSTFEELLNATDTRDIEDDNGDEDEEYNTVAPYEGD